MDPPGSRVVIVPDRGLHAINFETLPVAGATRHYFIEESSSRPPRRCRCCQSRQRRPPRADAAVDGQPCAARAGVPGAQVRVRRDRQRLEVLPRRRHDRLQGRARVARRYRTATPERFSYVHFTAHAAANLESPLDSAVILSGPDDAYKLYARDVAQVPLRAELVTVSACRSAGERSYSGEGLIGFSWAFLRAGASRVIAGLWDVDDRSTVQLMDDLYAKIAAGDPAAHALREAKLALIAKGGNYAKPYHWGPSRSSPSSRSSSRRGLSRLKRTSRSVH